MEKALDFDSQHRDQNHLDIAGDYFNYAKILYELKDIEEVLL